MKNPFLIFVFVLAHFHTICQEWGTVGYIPFAQRYDDLYFIDTQRGWTINSEGEIYKTIDGGLSWDTVYSSHDYLRTIEFINDTIGFVGSTGGRLLRTQDGGVTWTQIQDQIPGSLTGLCGMSHVGDNVYGVGVWYNPALFIKSEDQGITWTFKNMYPQARGLVDCHFLDENIGFVSGSRNGAVILKTTDGGNTWAEVYNSHDGIEYAWKLFFVNDTVAYASIESFNDSTSILKTTDGGNNWIELEVTPIGMDIQGIGFVNERKGWVSPRYSRLWETNDGGLSWQQISQAGNINRFFKVNDEVMVASGSAFHKYDSDIIFTPDPEPVKMHDILLAKPNPFSKELTLKIRIDRKTYARLDLISADGMHIISIQDGLLSPGIHFFELGPKDFYEIKSGLNILLLRTDEGFHTEKVVKTDH